MIVIDPMRPRCAAPQVPSWAKQAIVVGAYSSSSSSSQDQLRSREMKLEAEEMNSSRFPVATIRATI